MASQNQAEEITQASKAFQLSALTLNDKICGLARHICYITSEPPETSLKTLVTKKSNHRLFFIDLSSINSIQLPRHQITTRRYQKPRNNASFFFPLLHNLYFVTSKQPKTYWKTLTWQSKNLSLYFLSSPIFFFNTSSYFVHLASDAHSITCADSAHYLRGQQFNSFLKNRVQVNQH